MIGNGEKWIRGLAQVGDSTCQQKVFFRCFLWYSDNDRRYGPTTLKAPFLIYPCNSVREESWWSWNSCVAGEVEKL